MADLLFTWLLIAMCLGAGTIGGVFFAFSTFVMTALAQLPGAQGVAAMQRINVVVLNPLFLGVFVGTAALALGLAGLAVVSWQPPRSGWAIAAAMLYGAGSFVATMLRNVPMNVRLERLAPESADAADYWPRYVRDWSTWNHVRAAASIAAAGCCAAALAA